MIGAEGKCGANGQAGDEGHLSRDIENNLKKPVGQGKMPTTLTAED